MSQKPPARAISFVSLHLCVSESGGIESRVCCGHTVCDCTKTSFRKSIQLGSRQL